MTEVSRFWPILTATHRYDKSLSVRGHAHGSLIEAPILAYLIETRNGRILFDVGCDYNKINEPQLRQQYYDNGEFPFGPPQMEQEQRLPSRLAQLGLKPQDVDVVFCSHLHFDHAGGLCEMCHAEIHVQRAEWEAANQPADGAYFASDFNGPYRFRIMDGEYRLTEGVEAVSTPGHTAGHMSMWIELPRGAPILLAGDAADLTENIEQELAPGLCWQDDEAMALASIRKLKALAQQTGAELWPNHDMAFFRARNRFPDFFA